jgi:GR25 family glycosyltransferase involved in LPS biosynthesis
MKNFIIHLPSISESLKTATELKTNLEKFNSSVILFEGTRGDDAVRLMAEEHRKLHPHGLKGIIDPKSDVAKKMSSPGVKGCFYSHYNLWKKCIELDEPIIIWEDDIILYRPYIPIDWKDVLILALGHPTKSVRWMHLLESPEGEPAALEYRSPSMPGCCGYAIKPRAAKILVENYKNTFLPADNAINKTIVNMEIHNYIMGIAKVEGKKSLTRTKAWSNNELV